MALTPRNTMVRWHDRCVSTGLQIVAIGPLIFKCRTVVGTICITSMEHLGAIFGIVAPTEKKLYAKSEVLEGN